MFFVFGFLALTPLVSSAQVTRETLVVSTQNDFVVGPGKTEVFLNPGESMTKDITITSRMPTTVKFRLTTEDFVGSDDPQKTVVLLGDEAGPYSLKNFIQPEVKDFSLAPGERITIPVRVSIPKDAEPRGYYGALVVANDPQKIEGSNAKETEGKTRLISRIGSLFLVKINGKTKEEGTLVDFKVKAPRHSVYQKRPEGFEISFKNTGSVHLVPHGMVTIKNIFGTTIADIPVDAYFVLPDSTRYREVLWHDGFAMGPYSASLSLYKGYGSGFEESKIWFWVLPWKVILTALIVISVLGFALRYILTHFEFKKK